MAHIHPIKSLGAFKTWLSLIISILRSLGKGATAHLNSLTAQSLVLHPLKQMGWLAFV